MNRGLVNQDTGVRQCEALSGSPRRQQQSSHAGSLPNTDRGDVGTDELNRVVNRQTCCDRSAWAIEIQRDILLWILRLQEQQLGGNKIGDRVIDRSSQENDVVLQQT